MEIKMNRESYINYLRNQVYWINDLIECIESGKSRDEWPTWAVDLDLKPEFPEREDKLSA